MMIKEYYERVCAGDQVRQNLIALRDGLESEKDRKEFARLLGGDFSKLTALLENEDPKVRRNAASILGKLGSEDMLPILFDAYKKEKTLYIRADYLKAMAELDYRPVLSELEKRLAQLWEMEIPQEERKHIQEEARVLQRMTARYKKREGHRFVGWDEPLDLILITNRCLRKVTADRIESGELTMLAGGIRVKGAKVRELCALRTYREMLFPVDYAGTTGGENAESNVRTLTGQERQASDAPAVAGAIETRTPGRISAQQAVQIGAALAEPVLGLARRLHQGDGAFLFRLELKGGEEQGRKGVLLRRISDAVEQASGGALINSVSDYEMEIRLVERKDGTFLPMVKFCTIPDTRFAYRREVIAGSIAPVNAALAVELARPYLKEDAQVLDPFCGVGTMLIERDRAVKAGIMYGIDIFGEAIEKAKLNTKRAGCNVYYINKDFFAFEHGYLFDEIITDLPQVTANHPLQEIRELYRDFFDAAGRYLQPEALLVLYTTEPQLVTDALRVRREYKLIEKHTINEKNGTGVLIIKRNAGA